MFNEYAYLCPPEEPRADREEWREMDDEYYVVVSYECDGEIYTDRELEDENGVRACYESMLDEGINPISFAVCNVYREVSCYFGSCEDEYSEDVSEEWDYGDPIYFKEW